MLELGTSVLEPETAMPEVDTSQTTYSFIDENGNFGNSYGNTKIIFGRKASRKSDSGNNSYLYVKQTNAECKNSKGFIEVTCGGKGDKFRLNSPLGGDSFSPDTHFVFHSLYAEHKKQRASCTQELLIFPKEKDESWQNHLCITKVDGVDYFISTKGISSRDIATVTFYEGSKYYELIVNLLSGMISDNKTNPKHNVLTKVLSRQKLQPQKELL